MRFEMPEEKAQLEKEEAKLYAAIHRRVTGCFHAISIAWAASRVLGALVFAVLAYRPVLYALGYGFVVALYWYGVRAGIYWHWARRKAEIEALPEEEQQAIGLRYTGLHGARFVVGFLLDLALVRLLWDLPVVGGVL